MPCARFGWMAGFSKVSRAEADRKYRESHRERRREYDRMYRDDNRAKRRTNDQIYHWKMLVKELREERDNER